MSDHLYRGYVIILVPNMIGVMWACQYIIKQSNGTITDGFPDGETYESHEQAETAALVKAKELIDTSDLTKDPQLG